LPPRRPTMAGVGRLWGATLTVSDLDRAVDFYGRLLGLQLKYRFGDYAGFDCCGLEVGLKTWGGLEPPREGEPRLEFLVDDVDSLCEELAREGVKVVEGPKDVRWGARVAVVEDPDGNRVALIQLDWREYMRASSR